MSEKSGGRNKRPTFTDQEALLFHSQGRLGKLEVIALRRHRLGGDDLELAGTALAVEQQRFLVGECRSRAAAIAFRRHLNPLINPLAAGRRAKGSGSNAHRSRQANKIRRIRRPARLRRGAGGGRGSSPAAGRPSRLNGARERGKR